MSETLSKMIKAAFCNAESACREKDYTKAFLYLDELERLFITTGCGGGIGKVLKQGMIVKYFLKEG